MSPLLLYLLAINAIAFLAYVVDFLLCMRIPGLEERAANSLVMDLFPIAGGAVGTLLALFVVTGLGRGRRMNKNNVAWWFLAIDCLLVWGLVAATALGLVTLDASVAGLLTGWDLGKLKVLAVYLAVANVVTFAAFAWDKHVAATGDDPRRRIPEARLLALGLAGGAVGGILAMAAIRHKTRKWYFAWGLPLFAALHVAAALYAHMAGIL
jgi:uncharacterized membrane protein YsdA (DUF1294 family)